MTEVYLFAIFWLCLSGYGLFITLKKDLDEEDRDFFDELMEMERFIPPAAIAKMIIVFGIGMLAIDIMGFYLAYYHAYVNVNGILYRIMFFFACACVFITDQTIAMRYTVRISSAIKKLEDKPDVLRRWIDMNEPNTKTLAMLSAITKFTIALQLALFTVVSSFFL
ncbi:hypothetical protein [Anaerovibrio slackiae]|uniref:hypothetical protein n=2 Tax=Anaerovibrio slackiae TaxID=2652309 RepID=UPI003862EA4F|nr:hypothetical protein [Selenomonadaceae bacterium]